MEVTSVLAGIEEGISRERGISVLLFKVEVKQPATRNPANKCVEKKEQKRT